ncbi:MAG: 23S rRNA (pseudouridine(1915)-N(3))-methyltransferase RlmH [Erysipelotrichaceae bacterium]|nr:23S rRNA (pseudouridine(1915)-N(3))-methyltransferase RlmH [Erysipelotrichaceae bacterium]
MKITILSVGNIKEKYLKDAILEYSKRISKYSKIEFINVSDEPIMDNASLKEIEGIKAKEGEKLLKALPSNSYKIALNLKGEMLSSEGLANKILNIFSYHNANICFVIGGSLGLGDNVLSKMDYHLCFSKMTFPHQLMHVILLEQIYRAFKINNNETYHK